jgi:hypothetical protein
LKKRKLFGNKINDEGAFETNFSNERVLDVLKEVAEKFANDCTIVSDATAYEAFITGAKRQQERMYSEEEVVELLYKRDLYLLNRDEEVELELPNEWFEQFKKKIIKTLVK